MPLQTGRRILRTGSFQFGTPLIPKNNMILQPRKTLYAFIGCIFIVIFCHLVGATGANSSIPDWLLHVGIVWGNEDTNRVCTGVRFVGRPESVKTSVKLFFSDTNDTHRYLSPSGIKCTRVLLQDSKGTEIHPFPGKRLDSILPRRIAIGDLPRVPDTGNKYRGHTGGLRDWLLGNPAKLLEFNIQEVFPIEKEDDYTLTIEGVIYGVPRGYRLISELPANERFVGRVDLGKVSAKIHLKPSSEKK